MVFYLGMGGPEDLILAAEVCGEPDREEGGVVGLGP